MKKKIFAALLSAVLALTLLSGCSAESQSSDIAYEDINTESMSNSYSGSYGFDDMDALTDSSAAEPKEESASVDSTDSEATYERKIIRNGTIDMDADDAKACYAQLLDYAKSVGGYEYSCSVNSYEHDYSTSTYLTATIKLPPEELDAFMTKAGEFGTITYSEVTADEITAEYYDIQTRLDTLTASLDSYYALLEDAESVEEILAIQARIDELVTQIESLKGQLKLYDSLVDESTVNISISQYTIIPKPEKEFEWDSLDASTMGKLIKSGFLGVCNFLWSLLQWLFIIIVSALPILLIAGVIIWLVIRSKKKAKKEPTATQEPSTFSAEAAPYTAPEATIEKK